MSLPADDPAAYRFWWHDVVRYADLDMLGHVNNIAFAVYVEGGRGAFLAERGLWAPSGLPRCVVARVEIDYRHELRFPAQPRVGVRVLALGRSSFRVGVGVFDGERCVATSEAVLVCWDTERRGSAPLTEADRAALQPHLAA